MPKKEKVMDTFRKIVISDEIKEKYSDLELFDYPEECLNCFTSFIEITRHLRELYQYYEIFNYNYDMIKTLYPDGDIIALNSHTISLISAGKILSESTEVCIETAFEDGELKKNEFHKKYSSKEYDDNYSYRFLNHLRDFTQHGHIPISRLDGFLCFDLSQINDTTHFNFKRKVKLENEQIQKIMVTKTNTLSPILYQETVCAYACSIYKIFNAFMNNINLALKQKYDDCLQIAKCNPMTIHHKNHPELDGLILFIQNDNTLHAFNINDNPIPTHKQITKDSRIRLKKEKIHLKNLKSFHVPL